MCVSYFLNCRVLITEVGSRVVGRERSDLLYEEGKKSQNHKDKNGENKYKPNETPPTQKEPQKNKQNETVKSNPQELNEEEAEKLLGNLSEDLKKISRMQAAKDKSKHAYQGNQW